MQDRGEEIGQSRKGENAAEVDEGVHPVLVVSQSPKDLATVESVLCRSVKGLQSLDGLSPLSLVQEFGRARRIREEEEDDSGKKNGGRPLWLGQIELRFSTRGAITYR